MSNGLVERLTSRKFLLALLAGAVAFVNVYFGLDLTTEQVWTVIAPLLLFIGVEGAADFKARD